MIVQQEIAPLGTDGKPVVFTSQPVDTPVANVSTKTRENMTYKIVLTAVMLAIGMILNAMTSIMPRPFGGIIGRFSLVYAYCLISGIILGPVRGGACAALADLLMALISPESGMPWMPLISLSNLFMAFIPGLIYWLSGKKLNLTIILASVISFIVCTLGFSAWGETILFNLGYIQYYSQTAILVATGMPVYWAMVAVKVIRQPFWIALNMILAKIVLKVPAVQKRILDISTKKSKAKKQ